MDGHGGFGQPVQVGLEVGLPQFDDLGKRYGEALPGTEHVRVEAAADGEVLVSSPPAVSETLYKIVDGGGGGFPDLVEPGQHTGVAAIGGGLGKVFPVKSGHSGVAFDAHIQDGLPHLGLEVGVQSVQEVGYLLHGQGCGTEAVGQRGVVPPDIAAHVQVAHLPHRIALHRPHLFQVEQLPPQEQVQQPHA